MLTQLTRQHGSFLFGLSPNVPKKCHIKMSLYTRKRSSNIYIDIISLKLCYTRNCYTIR